MLLRTQHYTTHVLWLLLQTRISLVPQTKHPVSPRRDQIHTLWRFALEARSDPTKSVHSASTASPFTITETQTPISRCFNLKPNLPPCHADNALAEQRSSLFFTTTLHLSAYHASYSFSFLCSQFFNLTSRIAKLHFPNSDYTFCFPLVSPK